MRLSIIALIAAILMLLAGLSGCAKEKPTPTTVTTTAPTQSENQPEPEATPVQHMHCGLTLKLDTSFTTTTSAEDSNVFTFKNDKISGTVRFGALSELGNGAAQSKQYAETLKAQYGDAAWVGSGTGVGYYVVIKGESDTTVKCLYIYDQVSWLVEVKGDSSVTEQMTHIAGRCGWNAEQIPEI